MRDSAMAVPYPFVDAAGSPLPNRSGADPLPSWNDGPAKLAVTAFLRRLDESEFPPDDRVALFDAAVLWGVRPVYFQAALLAEQVSALARRNPALGERQPFKAVLDKDLEEIAGWSLKEILELVAATHADVRARTADDGAPEAAAPLYAEAVYQPQAELLACLRAHGFQTLIALPGGLDVMRLSVGDATGGPSAVVEQAPRLIAAGADSDLQRLVRTTVQTDPRLLLLIRHDDPERERTGEVGRRLERDDHVPEAASAGGWTPVSMRRDWKTLFGPLALH